MSFLEEMFYFGTLAQNLDLGSPVAIRIGTDITDNIPDMFLASGTPGAPPRTDPASSRSSRATSGQPPWIGDLSQNRWIFNDFH